MAKVAIVNGTTGQLSDICDEADKFEIYDGPDSDMRWVEVPDDCTYEHFMVNGEVIHKELTEDLRELALVDRVLAYGDIGEQLDMQYKDALDGGTRWKDHITAVKAATTKPSDIPEFVPNPKYIQLEGRKAWDPWVDNWNA
jgi:hypothetical protein